jgi:hypothetical protein
MAGLSDKNVFLVYFLTFVAADAAAQFLQHGEFLSSHTAPTFCESTNIDQEASAPA